MPIGTVTEYSPAASSAPYGACLGPDGNVWMVLRGTGKIAKVTPYGIISEYLIHASAGLFDICSGPDGRLWVTDYGRDKICAVTTSGTVTEYATTASAGAFGICSDGTYLWYCENLLGKVSQMNTSGTVLNRYAPTTITAPAIPCLGPDGNIWFTGGASTKIGKMTTGGSFTEYTVGGSPYGICSDGTNLWVTQQSVAKVTKSTTGGSMTDYSLTASADPRFITYNSADGCVYFGEYGLNKIGRITAGGSYTSYATTGTSRPLGVAIGADGSVWVGLNATSKIAEMDVNVRQTSDTWAWTDTQPPGWRTVPGARTIGTERSVFTGSSGASSHYGFPGVCRTLTNRLLAVSRRGTSHSSWDGSLVLSYSDTDGDSWSAESVIVSNATTGYDERDVSLTTLKSGRVWCIWGRRRQVLGVTQAYGGGMYSDDAGASWSSVHTFTETEMGWHPWTSGLPSGGYASDLVELGNGDLLVVGYGTIDATDAAGPYLSCTVTKSTDGGATWTYLSVAADRGADAFSHVEPQIERYAPYDKLIMTFHTEDGLPTNFYTKTSDDHGATWSSATLVDSNTINRQGLATLADGVSAIVSYQDGGGDFYYKESGNRGATWGSAVLVTATPPEGYCLWIMSVALQGVGEQQNIGFLYSGENAGQTKASTKYVQVSGTDGVFIYLRAGADSWAWSDAVSRTLITYVSRTTSDTWAWSDTAVGTTAFARTAADAWAWSDTAANTHATPSYYSRTTSDTWAWSERTTAPGTAFYWLRAARRRSMSAPTKTYVAVVPNGTTKTATYTSPTYEAKTEAGILVVLDVTAASGTGGLTVRINAHDQASSQAVALNAAPTAVTATGTTSYALYPFGAVAGNVTQATSFYLPRMFSISVTAGDSSSYTYSLGYCLLP